MEQPEITAEVARELLRYDPETGKLFWRERGPEWFKTPGRAEQDARTWNRTFSGREAFTAGNGNGYRRGSLLDVKLYAHRVVWLMATGAWPAAQLDHINGDRSDNRLENLREATDAMNAVNKARADTNTSGVTGVSLCKRSGKWAAYIKRHRKKHHLGRYADLEDAVAARKAAERRFGFHPNHGRD